MQRNGGRGGSWDRRGDWESLGHCHGQMWEPAVHPGMPRVSKCLPPSSGAPTQGPRGGVLVALQVHPFILQMLLDPAMCQAPGRHHCPKGTKKSAVEFSWEKTGKQAEQRNKQKVRRCGRCACHTDDAVRSRVKETGVRQEALAWQCQGRSASRRKCSWTEAWRR